ncbi:WD repeat-containing protein 44-like [Saccostrea echinata]|uniref:WD repeat-containing protein 44-like n=1 Tax=Saccostrea echinata TaxID=191078 RepID=UPI002A83741C|nr:WD repeat-containing protein 44-like [Saccostrea echinata]
MFLLRKLRLFSHSKCKEQSQSISDLSSLESLHDVGINNPGYSLKRSKSAEELNDDVIESLQTAKSQSFHSTASDSTDGSLDDYLQPCVDMQNESKSIKKIAIVNPTTHVFPEEEIKKKEPVEERLYENIETCKVSKASDDTSQIKGEENEGPSSIYQNVEHLEFKVENGNQESEYQNVVFQTETTSDVTTGNAEACEYEFAQSPETAHKTENSEQKINTQDEKFSEKKKSDVKQRLDNSMMEKGPQAQSIAVIVSSNVPKDLSKSSKKPAKKPKPARPPPPKFSTNFTPYKHRYTSPDLSVQQERAHKPPEKSISLDSPGRYYVNDPKLSRDNRAKLLFRNAKSASEQTVRKSENIDDYLDMSSSRPGDIKFEDTDDYMPMSLEDSCPLNAK